MEQINITRKLTGYNAEINQAITGHNYRLYAKNGESEFTGIAVQASSDTLTLELTVDKIDTPYQVSVLINWTEQTEEGEIEHKTDRINLGEYDLLNPLTYFDGVDQSAWWSTTAAINTVLADPSNTMTNSEKQKMWSVLNQAAITGYNLRIDVLIERAQTDIAEYQKKIEEANQNITNLQKQKV